MIVNRQLTQGRKGTYRYLMQSLRDATVDTSSNPETCARAVLDVLLAAMWFIRGHMRRHRTAGLSVPQFRALCLIDRWSCPSLGELADHLGSSEPSASRLVSGLVKRGFVERSTC